MILGFGKLSDVSSGTDDESYIHVSFPQLDSETEIISEIDCFTSLTLPHGARILLSGLFSMNQFEFSQGLICRLVTVRCLTVHHISMAKDNISEACKSPPYGNYTVGFSEQK